MDCPIERTGPAFTPVGGVGSRHHDSSPTFPRLSPATPRAYNGDTHGSHESGVCGSGSLGEKEQCSRVGPAEPWPDPPGALSTVVSTRWSLRGSWRTCGAAGSPLPDWQAARHGHPPDPAVGVPPLPAARVPVARRPRPGLSGRGRFVHLGIFVGED